MAYMVRHISPQFGEHLSANRIMDVGDAITILLRGRRATATVCAIQTVVVQTLCGLLRSVDDGGDAGAALRRAVVSRSPPMPDSRSVMLVSLELMVAVSGNCARCR